MAPNARNTARTIVILGFTVAALSGVIGYWQNVSSAPYQFGSFREILIPLLNPLITIVAVAAWWWLSRLEARDDEQLRYLRIAYIAFGVQYFLYAALYVLIVTPLDSQAGSWTTTVLWLDCVGAVVASFGLFLMARYLFTREDFDQLVPVSEEVS
jgi:hypothetical protein